MDSQNLPSETRTQNVTFAEQHPILKQAWDDAVQLSWQQMGVPVLGVLANLLVTLIHEYRADHLHGWPDAETFVYSLIWSALIGISLYALVAIIRAPFIVLGRQQRQLLDVNNRLADVESRPVASSTPLLSAGSVVPHDSAEPNIVMRLDGDLISGWGGSDCVYEGESSTFPFKVFVIRCKNERDCMPARKVGAIGNVTGEISFTEYGTGLNIVSDLAAWLSESSDRVQFPVGVTHRLIVAKAKESGGLFAIQRRSGSRGTNVWERKLAGEYCRVRVALFAESERKPLAQGDYILERDSRLFGGDLAGPQLVPTRSWRRMQVLRFQNRLLKFWLENEGVPAEQVHTDYKTCESEAAKFIEQHYGGDEKKHFLFERDENQPSNPLRRLRAEPQTFRERVNAQTKQLERLKETAGRP